MSKKCKILFIIALTLSPEIDTSYFINTMKDILQTLLIAMAIGLIVFCVVIIFDRNSNSIEWNKRAAQVRAEAERTSENVDNYVKKGKRVYSKLKEMEEEDIGSHPVEPKITPPPPTPKPVVAANTPPVSANKPLPMSTPTLSSGGTVYQLQVGRLSSNTPNLSSFAALQPLGTLSTELNGGDHRVILGNFANRNQADAALATVRNMGFGDAFVVTRNNNNVVTTNSNNTKLIAAATGNNAAMPVATVGGLFVVQVVANQFPVSSDYKSLSVLGSIFQEKNPDLTKIMLGTFKDEATARKALQTVKDKGFSGAFIKNTNWSTINNWQRIY